MKKFLAATAIGAIIGVLLAPDKGAKTRAALVDNYEKLSAYLTKLFGKEDGTIEELRSNLEQELEDLETSIKSKIMGLFDEAVRMKKQLPTDQQQ